MGKTMKMRLFGILFFGLILVSAAHADLPGDLKDVQQELADRKVRLTMTKEVQKNEVESVSFLKGSQVSKTTYPEFFTPCACQAHQSSCTSRDQAKAKIVEASKIEAGALCLKFMDASELVQLSPDCLKAAKACGSVVRAQSIRSAEKRLQIVNSQVLDLTAQIKDLKEQKNRLQNEKTFSGHSKQLKSSEPFGSVLDENHVYPAR